jgi:hypothetical protein
MMNQLAELIVLVACAFAVFKAGMYYAVWCIERDLEDLANGNLAFDDDDVDSDDVLSKAEYLNITKEGAVFFAYGAKNKFLAQANDLHGLFINIKDRFPHTTWLINDKDQSLSQEEQDSIMPTLKSIFNESNKND